jgi:zinc transport system permease protein
VIDLIVEALQLGFMRNALAAGVLVSVACGIVGTLIVVRRIVFVSGGVAHAAYGGIGLAYFLGISPLLGAILFSLLAALGMGAVQRRTRERTDTLIGVMWAIGMAVGIVLVDLTPGYKAELMSYLFGSILAVPSSDLLIMLILDVVIVLLVGLFYKELVAVSFDEVFATVENVPVTTIYMVLMAMIGLTVVMLMRVVGLILVIAMLTIPAAISGQFVRDVGKMMFLASCLGVVFMTVGLWLSYSLNLTSGATIILFSGVAYLASRAVQALTRGHRASSDSPTGQRAGR